MTDWWSRIGPVLAIASGLGYVLGAVTLSELARPFGVTAASLGIDVRDYVTIAAVSGLTIGYLATVVMVFLWLVVGLTTLYVAGKKWGDLFGAQSGLLMIGALLQFPVQWLAGDLNMAAVVFWTAGLTVMLSFGLIVWLPARSARSRVSAEEQGESAGSNQPSAVSKSPEPTTLRAILAWARAHPVNVVAATAVAVGVLGIGSAITARLYAEELVDVSRNGTPVPRPPGMFGLIIDPAWTCVASEKPTVSRADA